MKKIISLILALVMVMGLAVGASAASITITTPSTAPEDTNTAHETYTAYKIFDATYEGTLGADTPISYTIDSGNPFYDTIATSGYFTLEQINTSTVYNVTKNTNFDATAAATLATSLKAVIDADATITGTDSTDSVINVTDKGYYLITSSLGSKMVVDTLDDITIETKNEFPTLTKVSDKETAAFGETVTYTVTVNVPATAVGEIKVIDTMTNLTYVDLAEGATEGVTDSANEKVVTFTIPADVVATNLGDTVTIKYTATVDANATTASNEAYLTYSNFTSTTVDTELANYKVDVFKHKADNTGLAGAGFVLMSGDKYYNLTDGIVSWVESIDNATEYTTAADSYTVTFNGLANGTYTLVEKTVPAGYNKANDTEVKVENADRTGAIKDQGTQIEVLNQTGSELPSTGGIGTTLFYVIGGLLMTGAVVLLVTKKRMA